MKLYIAGIVHFDPLGREKIGHWLTEISRVEATPPLFAAVEYSERFYENWKSQRENLRSLAAFTFPNATNDQLDLIAGSFLYEADSHDAVYRGLTIPKVRLDNKREDGADAENKFTLSVVTGTLHTNLDFLTHERRTGNLTEDLSRGMWDRNSNWPQGVRKDGKRDADRDKLFANEILEAFGSHSDGWTIAIIGASHAASVEDSTLTVLKKKNVECLFTPLDTKYRFGKTN